jgi:hypothetical protein
MTDSTTLKKADIKYELFGIMNNAEIHITGKGQADATTGRYEMELYLHRIPFCWDPAFNFLMTDTMSCYMSQERGGASNISSISDGKHVVNWRGAYLYDQTGRHVGHVTASSEVVRTGNNVSMNSHIHSGYVWLAPHEHVTEIESPYQGALIAKGNATLLTTGYSFKTNLGKYWGYTTYPYVLANHKTIPGPQIATFEDITIRREDDKFFYSRKTYVEPLAIAQTLSN